jgi:hypothetical protein
MTRILECGCGRIFHGAINDNELDGALDLLIGAQRHDGSPFG